ncbi:hypothetical protein HYE67_007869 [Fusarium culmorum]|uniref:Uncharacterized protein n=1 Tax=Fusarium culmorum TaxID=5516 RepID=A0A2T4GES0_FUSCU|nr:hypothetical protein FCULG_00012919 [Fusarium culmorum]QPC65638.1 hypothetical protein HYE67_007869 [Fusarium culmorum]
MCYKRTICLSCEDCGKAIKTTYDYGLCRIGRRANFWGMCRDAKMMHEALPGVCTECIMKKRERRKKKEEEEKKLKEVEEMNAE